MIGLGAALTTILLLSLAWGLQHAALSNPPVLGRAAPELTIQTLSGQRVSVSGLRGTRVVLNFWASWCGPCLEERDVLTEGQGKHHGVAFVGADNRDTASAFRDFETRYPHYYPSGPIIEGSYQSYGVSGLPATFFIDAQGTVVASFSGPLSSSLLDHYLAVVGA